MIKPATLPTRKPPEHLPKRKCRCGDCRNEIHAMTTCNRVNGRNVCESCGARYAWNPAAQRWELRTDPAPVPQPTPKPRIGRPPLGDAACEARWHVKATNEEDAMLQRLATEHTRGNKSEFLRLAVRTLASKNINFATINNTPRKS